MSDDVSLAGYTFPANKAALVCTHVFESGEPIRIYAHHADGDVQFTCGEPNHNLDNLIVVCLEHVLSRAGEDVADLPTVDFGELTTRTDEGWLVEPFDD